MSFASETKKELTQLEVHIEHAKAELEALIRMNGSLSLFNRHEYKYRHSNQRAFCQFVSMFWF